MLKALKLIVSYKIVSCFNACSYGVSQKLLNVSYMRSECLN